MFKGIGSTRDINADDYMFKRVSTLPGEWDKLPPLRSTWREWTMFILSLLGVLGVTIWHVL